MSSRQSIDKLEHPAVVPRRPPGRGVVQPPKTAQPLQSPSFAAVALHNRVPLTSGEWKVVAVYLGLAERESEIARLVLDGLPELAIASRLSLSCRTVHGHLERLFRKLGIHRRHELVSRLFSAYLSACAGRTDNRL